MVVSLVSRSLSRSRRKKIDQAFWRAQSAGTLVAPETPAMRKCLYRLVKTGELVRPLPGCYARASYWSELSVIQKHVACARALAHKHPEWVFCNATAAAIMGLRPSNNQLRYIHVATPPNVHHRCSKHVIFHRKKHLHHETYDGLRVTTPERTVFDCARTFPLPDGLAVADAAQHRFRWRQSYMLNFIKRHFAQGRYHGVARAITVAILMDSSSESGGESIARANFMRLGYVLPKLQVKLVSPANKTKPYRIDYLWSTPTGELIAGELDGKAKYVDPEMLRGQGTLDALMAERERESNITSLGIKVMRFNFRIATDLNRLEDLMRAFGIPRCNIQPHDSNRSKVAEREFINYRAECERLSMQTTQTLNQRLLACA